MSNSPDRFEVLYLSECATALVRSLFDPEHTRRHPGETIEAGNRVIVIRTSDLESMLAAAAPGFIVDRGTKNDAKPLSHYFLGRDGLLAIRTRYKDTGQTMRGLRALLDVAARFKTHVSCIVGVDSLLFDGLAKHAGPAAPSGAGSVVAADNSGLLLDDKITVPASLKRKFIGESPQIDCVRRSIVLASRVIYPVLIQGETGTGKEIVARKIHELSPRGEQKFIPVNCGGISPELFESELFGHTIGAFTGATAAKSGLWTVADKGTIFLDEIGDMPMHHQVKVLRAIDDGTFIPVGAEDELKSHARVIAATNRDLARMVAAGKFREDLYYRLFSFRILTPALREHLDDLPLLIRHFWADIHTGTAPALTNPVIEALARYKWPGNARELRSFLINLMLLANGRRVDVALVHAVMRERLGPAMAKGRDL